jgi:hypothetical protein
MANDAIAMAGQKQSRPSFPNPIRAQRSLNGIYLQGIIDRPLLGKGFVSFRLPPSVSCERGSNSYRNHAYRIDKFALLASFAKLAVKAFEK